MASRDAIASWWRQLQNAKYFAFCCTRNWGEEVTIPNKRIDFVYGESKITQRHSCISADKLTEYLKNSYLILVNGKKAQLKAKWW